MACQRNRETLDWTDGEGDLGKTSGSYKHDTSCLLQME